jgi:hypothetical protein
MKAQQQADQFKPVTLTLETQAEVDAIFAVLNNSSVRQALEFEQDTYKVLHPYSTANYNKFHQALNELAAPAKKQSR